MKIIALKKDFSEFVDELEEGKADGLLMDDLTLALDELEDVLDIVYETEKML